MEANSGFVTFIKLNNNNNIIKSVICCTRTLPKILIIL